MMDRVLCQRANEVGDYQRVPRRSPPGGFPDSGVRPKSYWGAVVPLVLGIRSSGNAWGFPWSIHSADAYFAEGIRCGIVTTASSSMRSGY